MRDNNCEWAIGGGCLLPGFKKLLEKNGFKILDNPVEANVSGLLEMAKTISSKNLTGTSLK
ncbi:Cell division ATPase FtsA (plasmid) [Nostoc flagelliforme CCNUN1]|uniref:Cell division ATPase FtsA n=1 Tax=Nostoc flagelliforme CCNUN1 TaxID=2038116 RepID=A0A2K8T5R6_9NOSO|nr:Cell division ATPase FtsA [Nostoc flagelliforme CCNUN1]